LVSSQLALGIGVLEFCTPFGLALESIADYLTHLANSIIVQQDQNAKQCKINFKFSIHQSPLAAATPNSLVSHDA
jgi:hypothetical protein